MIRSGFGWTVKVSDPDRVVRRRFRTFAVADRFRRRAEENHLYALDKRSNL